MTPSGEITNVDDHGNTVEFTRDGKRYEISQSKIDAFRVALDELQAAIDDVDRTGRGIQETMNAIGTKMSLISTYWNSPSFQSYDDVRNWFDRTQLNLYEMLQDIVHRMKISHENYSSTEMANLANLTDDNGQR